MEEIHDRSESRSEISVENAPKEKFRVTDHSLTAPFLQRLVSDQVLKIVPKFYSPNALTLSGGFCAVCSASLIWIFADEMRAGSLLGKSFMMASAIFLVIYGVFDQLDGMQARKLKRSSKFGDFLDHWVDALIANAYTVPVMVLLGVDFQLIWLMAIVTALAFWAHNWETRNINRRELPAVGGLESIWTAFVIMTLTCIFGVQVWQYELGGISLLDIFYWCGLSALLWVVISALRHSRERLKDYLGFLVVIAPISIWLTIYASHYMLSTLHVFLGFTSLGLMATLLTGNVMRHHWLKSQYTAYDKLSFVAGTLLCLAGLANNNLSFISEAENMLLLIVTAFLLIRILRQGLGTYADMKV